MQGDEPIGSGLFGPATDAPKMPDIAQYHDSGSQFSGPGNALRHNDRARHLAQTGLSVESQGRLIVRNQRRTPAAQDDSRIEIGEVGRHPKHAVRIVPDQIGLSEAEGNRVRFLLIAACCPEQGGDETCKPLK